MENAQPHSESTISFEENTIYYIVNKQSNRGLYIGDEAPEDRGKWVYCWNPTYSDVDKKIKLQILPGNEPNTFYLYCPDSKEYICCTEPFPIRVYGNFFNTDSTKRPVLAVKSKNDECLWLFEKDGEHYHIKSAKYGKVLYDSGDIEGLEKTKVFVWNMEPGDLYWGKPVEQPTAQALWKVEKHSE